MITELTDDERSLLTTALLLYFFSALAAGDQAGVDRVSAFAKKFMHDGHK